MKKLFLLSLLLQSSFTLALEKLVILIVIDSLSYHSLKKAQPFLSGGLAYMLSHGISFEQAHYQYAFTETGPGHTTISTGCWPSMHGIIGNSWISDQGEKIYCVQDPHNNKKRSPSNICVDGIADQLILSSYPQSSLCIALALKSRAAICLATRMGKAFWFDSKNGLLTSSTAYIDSLPQWAQQCNQKYNPLSLKKIEWHLRFDKKHKAYDTALNASKKPSLIDQVLIAPEETSKRASFFASYKQYPISNKLLLDCALTSLKEYSNTKENMYLCIGLSSLDRITHFFGPDSYEYIDTIYHLDTYLQEFFAQLFSVVGAKDILICLTADHGNVTIPEIHQQAGFSLAKRIDSKQLIMDLNQMLYDTYGIEDMVLDINNFSLFLNQEKLKALKKKVRKKIMHTLKIQLKKVDGIKDAWTEQELIKIPASSTDFITYIKNQIFPGRSGSLYYQLFPYCLLSPINTGTGHYAPYNYATHVPLIIMHKNKTAKSIKENVWMTQLAPTIAEFFGIQKPSACLQNSLPGINLQNT